MGDVRSEERKQKGENRLARGGSVGECTHASTCAVQQHSHTCVFVCVCVRARACVCACDFGAGLFIARMPERV